MRHLPTVMRHLGHVAAAGMLAVTGCGRQPSKSVPLLPRIEIADVPVPACQTVIVARGETLQAIATTAYEHEDFSGFVARLNGVPAPERLQAGATIKTPSLPVAFRDSGLDVRYQSAINALAKARDDFAKILPDYTKARDDSGAKDGDTFLVPTDVQNRLTECADTMDAALDLLSHPAEGHATPRKSIAMLAGTSKSLRSFASGLVQSRDYDTFLAGKGFGLGFTYLLIWVQQRHL